jgi:hypothetical protein
MEFEKLPRRPTLIENRIAGKILAVPVLLIDFIHLLIRPFFLYVAPIAFIVIGLLLYIVLFLDLGKETSGTSNAVTAMLVALSALGFGWGSAIGKDDPDFGMVMQISKRFMHSVVSFILATGFKFAILRLKLPEFLPWQGNGFRIALFLVMALLFAKALIDAALPILRINAYLIGQETALPGLTLVKAYMPRLYDKVSDRFKGGGRAGRNPREATA